MKVWHIFLNFGQIIKKRKHEKLVTSKRQKLDLMPSDRIQHHKPFRFYSGKNKKGHLDLQETSDTFILL